LLTSNFEDKCLPVFNLGIYFITQNFAQINFFFFLVVVAGVVVVVVGGGGGFFSTNFVFFFFL